jgi:ubiquinone/menaquinone biosynthesis C-methylase UbiE
MGKLLKTILDYESDRSLPTKMRRSRFKLFLNLLKSVPKPISILDVGGTEKFWKMMAFTNPDQIHFTLLNLKMPAISLPNFMGITGDATSMSSISDQQFDVVFSNSVIEHVGDFNQQRLMASEIQRVGKRYFVQTPNYYFPIEPHFLFPAFQWLPKKLRFWLIQNFNLGHIKRISDPTKAKEMVNSTRLIKRRELLILFPDSIIIEEKYLGLVKSFIVYNQDW